MKVTTPGGGALALNPAHGKSLSRRAQVQLEVRLPDAAVSDLELLLSVINGVGGGKVNSKRPNGVGAMGPPPGSEAAAAAAAIAAAAAVGMGRDHAQGIRDRLRDAKFAVHDGEPPDHYKILGLAAGSGASAADVKKGYRQLALKHHPDKSCNGLPSWADAESLRSEADRIFKLVGEANATLSDGKGHRRVRSFKHRNFNDTPLQSSSVCLFHLSPPVKNHHGHYTPKLSRLDSTQKQMNK